MTKYCEEFGTESKSNSIATGELVERYEPDGKLQFLRAELLAMIYLYIGFFLVQNTNWEKIAIGKYENERTNKLKLSDEGPSSNAIIINGRIHLIIQQKGRKHENLTRQLRNSNKICSSNSTEA